MNIRNVHSGKSALEKRQYYRRIKEFRGEKPTGPGETKDIDPESTEAGGETPKPKTLGKRPEDKKKEQIENLKYHGINILKYLSLPIVLFIVGHYYLLSINVGKIEERIKDLPGIENEIRILGEKINSVDKRLEISINDNKRSFELINYKLEEIRKSQKE